MKRTLSLILALIVVWAPVAAFAQAGTYEGSAPGYHGEVAVAVDVDEGGAIAKIEVRHEETEGIGTVAAEKLPQRVVEAQSLGVDAVSGATVTSNAILAATASALEKAGIDPAALGYAAPAGKKGGKAEKKAADELTAVEKAPKTGSITVTDVKGREVTIDLPVSTYAVSTMDVVDFIVPLKGEDAFHMLVGSGNSGGKQAYDDIYFPMFPDLERQVGILSEHNAPFDLEMILARDPDVLIVNSAMQAHKYALDVEAQLTAAGIPIVLIDVPGKSIDTSVQQTVALLGQIFEESEKAEEFNAFIDAQFDLLRAKNLSARSDKPTVYYEKSGYSEIYGSTSTSASGWGSVIAYAGGDNIADAVLMESGAAKGGSNVLDPEYVLTANPDFVILSGVNSLGLGKDPALADNAEFDIVNRPGWAELSAVQNENVYEIMHELSRTVYSFYPCLKLAKIFYPDEFQDVDPDALLAEFFDRYTLIDSDMGVWTVRYHK
jgi:iron complex transport system substrate-binding protein